MLTVFVQEQKKKKCPNEHQFPLLFLFPFFLTYGGKLFQIFAINCYFVILRLP